MQKKLQAKKFFPIIKIYKDFSFQLFERLEKNFRKNQYTIHPSVS